MNWKNQVTRLLNIKYPLIQAPMFGVTTPEMVAGASEAKILGSLPLGDLTANKCVETIRATREKVNKPFAVNFFASDNPQPSESLKTRYEDAKRFIENLAEQHHLEVDLTGFDSLLFTDYHEQIDAIIEENCKIVSFTFGNLDEQSIQKLKANDTVLIGTCTSVKEAEFLERSGIDLICVQGTEAGGHRGSFLDNNTLQIGGLSLLAQVYDSVKVPLIYAGGIYNGKTLMAAQTFGARGFQVGSLLLGANESALSETEKQRLRNLKEEEIITTRAFSGRYARGIKNIFTEVLSNSGHILPYPFQNKLTSELRRIAKLNNNVEFSSIWVGQSINGFAGISTVKIVQQLIEDAEANASFMPFQNLP